MYTYTVVAQYPNGHTGPSNSISYTPAKPPAPTEFDSGEQGNDIVLAWSMPAGAYDPDRFMLFGPGLRDGLVGRNLPGHVDDAASCYARWRRAVMTRIDRDPQSYTWPLTHELSVPAIRTDLRNLESGGTSTGIQITPQCAADQPMGTIASSRSPSERSTAS